MRTGIDLRTWGFIVVAHLGAFVHTTQAQDWQFVRSVPLSDQPEGALLSMDVDDDLLVVGIAHATGGLVRVHGRNEEGLGQWGVVQELVGDQPYFGHAVALADGKLAIGVPGAAEEGALTGAVILCNVVQGGVSDPVQPVDTLFGAAAGDRFGFGLLWVGDTLLVGAVGRSLDRFTGEVPLFGTAAGALSLGSLPARWQDTQIPFTRWFGKAMAQDRDRLAVAAPYSGFRTEVARQNIGALFLYQRDGNATSGWSLDTVWFDTDVLDDGCTFEHIELGRNGVAFAGNALVLDHGASYTGGSGNALVPFQSLDPNVQIDGCSTCGLRIVEQAPEGWSFDAVVPTQQPAEWDRMAEGGWTTDAGSIYVERGNSVTGEWVTTIHQRDAGGPGTWGVAASLPAMDEDCDVLTGPIVVRGNDLIRIALRRPDCGAPADVQRSELQIFAR